MTLRAVLIGMAVMLAGTLPRNALFVANLRIVPAFPWAVPIVAVYLWIFWRYLRRAGLRAGPVSARVWVWSLIAGGLGIVALVLGLRLLNRLVVLPTQELPAAFLTLPRITALTLLFAAAPIAGIVEESAFRGFMQEPIERAHGLMLAILITGTMFAVAHLDFTPALWPYYVAVSAIYGVVTYHAKSVLPAIVLHTAGNTYSNLDLWLHGRSDWQSPGGPNALIWNTGVDAAFWKASVAFVVVAGLTVWAYGRLARVSRQEARRRGEEEL